MMPVLSFPCVVTHYDGASLILHRHTWIKGHDHYALALAAAEQNSETPDAPTQGDWR